jgi:hypothetical protein
MYQAPHDLMTQGFFSDVREICKTEGTYRASYYRFCHAIFKGHYFSHEIRSMLIIINRQVAACKYSKGSRF